MFGNKKGLEDKLSQDGGTIAWATILSADEKWTTARGGDSGFGGPSSVTSHMKVTLRVEPEAEPAFEATLKQAFRGHVPRPGGRAKVIYDPADRSKIAILEDAVYMPGLSIEQQDRSRARMKEAQKAAESGHMAEYIEQRKAEAMASAGRQQADLAAMLANAGAPKPDIVDQLAKLADLRDRGALTEAEFAAQKAKLLGTG